MLRKKPQLIQLKKLFPTKAQYQPAQQKPLPSLTACILMDLLGYASFAIPVLGEFLDIIWAPISALVFFKMFGGAKGLFGGAFSFFEELMPGLDFIPTFTIAWMIQFSRRKNQGTYIIPMEK
jgi:hypothetical protein